MIMQRKCMQTVGALFMDEKLMEHDCEGMEETRKKAILLAKVAIQGFRDTVDRQRGNEKTTDRINH